MSKLIRFQPLTALALTSLAVIALTAGCKEAQDLQDAACCTDFVVGADMTTVDFDLEGQVKGQYTALAQASGDLSAVATGALGDVGTACKNLAVDMGASSEDIADATAKNGDAAVTAWCNLATAQIDATFGAKAEAKGKLSVVFAEPVCTASIDAQAKCEGSCTASGSCDVNAEPPKCTGGKLTVECSGDCDVTAESPSVSCTGTCTGECSGSCTAEAGATIDCEGTCEGSCTVDGTAASGSGVQADGTCMGKCDGKCTASANAKVECSGKCEGSCNAKCEAQPGGVKMTCDGKCDGEFEAPKCEGGSAEVSCDADVDCKANCSASVSARAECTPPSLTIAYELTGSAEATAAVQAKIDAGIASLKANLPNILVVFQARGESFADGITATVNAAASIDAGSLSAKAVGCLIPIGAAVGEASTNFASAFNASGKVVAAVGI